MSKLTLNYDSVAVSTATELGKKTAYDAIESAKNALMRGTTISQNVNFTSGGVKFKQITLNTSTGELYFGSETTGHQGKVLVYKGFYWGGGYVFDIYMNEKFRYVYDLSTTVSGLTSTKVIDVLKLGDNTTDAICSSGTHIVSDSKWVGTDPITFKFDAAAAKKYIQTNMTTTGQTYNLYMGEEVYSCLTFPIGKITQIEFFRGTANNNGQVRFYGPDPEGLDGITKLHTWTISTSWDAAANNNVRTFKITDPSTERDLSTLLTNFSSVEGSVEESVTISDFTLGASNYQTQLAVYECDPRDLPPLTEDVLGYNSNSYVFDFLYKGKEYCAIKITDNAQHYAIDRNGNSVQLPTNFDFSIEELTPMPYNLKTKVDNSSINYKYTVTSGMHTSTAAGSNTLIGTAAELKACMDEFRARKPRKITLQTPMSYEAPPIFEDKTGINSGDMIFEIGSIDAGAYLLEVFDEIPTSNMSHLITPSCMGMIYVPFYDNEFAHSMSQTFKIGDGTVRLFNTSTDYYQDGAWALKIDWKPTYQEWTTLSDGLFDSSLGIRIRKL